MNHEINAKEKNESAILFVLVYVFYVYRYVCSFENKTTEIINVHGTKLYVGYTYTFMYCPRVYLLFFLWLQTQVSYMSSVIGIRS